MSEVHIKATEVLESMGIQKDEPYYEVYFKLLVEMSEWTYEHLQIVNSEEEGSINSIFYKLMEGKAKKLGIINEKI